MIWESLLSKLGLNLFQDFYSMIKKRFNIPLIKDYSWTPNSPLKNQSATKDIKEHGKDIKFDFKAKRLLNECVQGQDAFLQHLVKHICTPKNAYEIYKGTKYGNEQALTIFAVKDVLEFKRQCEYMANHIISYEHYKDYIQEIYSIKRKKACIYIEMKLNGTPGTVTCQIPNLNKNL